MATQETPALQIEYMHICEYAFIKEGNNPCIIGIFDGIASDAFPAQHAQMVVAVKFRGRARNVVTFRVVVTGPDGRPIGDLGEQQTTLGHEGASFCRVMLYGLPLPVPGRYTITVTSQGEVLGSQMLRVLKKVQAA